MQKKHTALIISLIVFVITLVVGCCVAMFPIQLTGLFTGTMTFQEAVQSGTEAIGSSSSEISTGTGSVADFSSNDDTEGVLMPYYYHQLSEEERIIYDEVYAVMTKHGQDVKISAKDSDSVSTILDYILWDHPEIYYSNGITIETITVGSSVTIKVSSQDYMDDATREHAKSVIDSYCANCLNQLHSEMSNYEKAVKIYEYVCNTITYDSNAAYNQSLYSAACGATVCQGYASAFQYLCKQAGIPCIKVTGKLQQENHAWNMVYLDGMWCYVDCTSGDSFEKYGIATDYSWFGMNDTMLSRTHTLYNQSILPHVSEISNLYYYRIGRYYTSYDLSNIADDLSSGKDFSFQCSSSTVYQTYMSELETSQEVGRYLPSGKQVQFMGAENTLTIYIEY